jgi:arsenate reductase (glutaredoxin)
MRKSISECPRHHAPLRAAIVKTAAHHRRYCNQSAFLSAPRRLDFAPGGKGIATMSDIIIYHNPRCSKSRQSLQLLEERGVKPDIVLYLENPPSKKQLQELLKKLGIGARALLRGGEQEYKQRNLADASLSDAALIDAMVACPQLIERPIVVRGARAVIGRPPENVLELLDR